MAVVRAGVSGPLVGVVGDLQSLQDHDSVVGLWSFERTLEPDNSKGAPFVVEAGTVAYARIAPGRDGLVIGTGARVGLPAPLASLQIAGALTIDVLILRLSTVTAGNSLPIVAHGLAGGVDTDPQNNTLYQFQQIAGATDALLTFPSYFSESGAGVDQTETTPLVSLGTYPFLNFLPELWTMTRQESGSVRFYLNGSSVHESGALTPPDGGSLGRLTLASIDGGTNPLRIMFGGLRIAAQASSPAQVALTARQVFGSDA